MKDIGLFITVILAPRIVSGTQGTFCKHRIFIGVRCLFGKVRLQAGAVSKVPICKIHVGPTMTPLDINPLTHYKK